MAIISFKKTTDEFMAGIKTCTRRDWSARQTRMWQNFWDTGRLIHTAYDKNPHREPLRLMPLTDLKEEGGMCDSWKTFLEFIGINMYSTVTVIRFERIVE